MQEKAQILANILDFTDSDHVTSFDYESFDLEELRENLRSEVENNT